MKISKRIKTVEELEAAAKSKRSVIVPSSQCWYKPCPAAFVINLQGHILVQLFRKGMYLYNKKET